MDADAVAKNVARRRRSVDFVMVVWFLVMVDGCCALR